MKADFILLKVLMKKFSWDTEFVIMNTGVDNTRFPGNHEDIIYSLFIDAIPIKTANYCPSGRIISPSFVTCSSFWFLRTC